MQSAVIYQLCGIVAGLPPIYTIVYRPDRSAYNVLIKDETGARHTVSGFKTKEEAVAWVEEDKRITALASRASRPPSNATAAIARRQRSAAISSGKPCFTTTMARQPDPGDRAILSEVISFKPAKKSSRDTDGMEV